MGQVLGHVDVEVARHSLRLLLLLLLDRLLLLLTLIWRRAPDKLLLLLRRHPRLKLLLLLLHLILHWHLHLLLALPALLLLLDRLPVLAVEENAQLGHLLLIQLPSVGCCHQPVQLLCLRWVLLHFQRFSASR